MIYRHQPFRDVCHMVYPSVYWVYLTLVHRRQKYPSAVNGTWRLRQVHDYWMDEDMADWLESSTSIPIFTWHQLLGAELDVFGAANFLNGFSLWQRAVSTWHGQASDLFTYGEAYYKIVSSSNWNCGSLKIVSSEHNLACAPPAIEDLFLPFFPVTAQMIARWSLVRRKISHDNGRIRFDSNPTNSTIQVVLQAFRLAHVGMLLFLLLRTPS